MEYIDQLQVLHKRTDFFEYHGFVLTACWIIACSVAIFMKRINVYIHAMLFFFIDVTSLYFITGAWLRVYPHIDTFNEWSLIKKGHIIGGNF